MNATAESFDQSLPAPLAALAARTQALRAADEHDRVVARARETVAAAKVEVDKYADEEAASVTRHQKRLSDWVVAGNHGTPPVVVPSERSAVAKRSAEVTHAAAVLMLADLEATAAHARADLIQADRAVAAAIASLRPVEIAAAERECVSLLSQFMERYAEIHVRNDLYGNDVFDNNVQHQRLRGAFQACVHSAGGEMNVPHSQRGENAPILVAARARLAQRDARLLAGESDQLTEGQS